MRRTRRSHQPPGSKEVGKGSWFDGPPTAGCQRPSQSVLTRRDEADRLLFKVGCEGTKRPGARSRRGGWIETLFTDRRISCDKTDLNPTAVGKRQRRCLGCAAVTWNLEVLESTYFQVRVFGDGNSEHCTLQKKYGTGVVKRGMIDKGPASVSVLR